MGLFVYRTPLFDKQLKALGKTDKKGGLAEERVGSLIRFNEAFLDFLRIFPITPHACNVRAPHEKGKIENSIKYIRQNFWPLRTFADLADVQKQVVIWLDTVANVRVHQTTGEHPVDRLRKEALRPLPNGLPDCRETASLKVHKDFGVRFDGNVYTVPPWTIGKISPSRQIITASRFTIRTGQLLHIPAAGQKRAASSYPVMRSRLKKSEESFISTSRSGSFCQLIR